MEISDNLRCLFSAQLEERRDSYVIEIPKQEIRLGNIESDTPYRVAMFSPTSGTETGDVSASSTTEPTAEPETTQEREPSRPPVDEGDIREVDIEDIGQQGDGITRVERGFVVIVPDTEKGERVTIEITDVQQNVAFGTVKERQTHFQ